MKNNTEKAVMLISQAIGLCADFALSSAKRHLYSAITEINNVTKKRNKRESLKIQMDQQLNQKKIQLEILRKKMVAELEQKQIIEKGTSKNKPDLPSDN